jgi:fermentation-respiration switch protein FrsA (DUF1100 family)
MAQLVAAGYRVTAPDGRGHGESDRASDYATATIGADAAALIVALGLDKPVVIGHSMGGGITLATLENYGQNYSSNGSFRDKSSRYLYSLSDAFTCLNVTRRSHQTRAKGRGFEWSASSRSSSSSNDCWKHDKYEELLQEEAMKFGLEIFDIDPIPHPEVALVEKEIL